MTLQQRPYATSGELKLRDQGLQASAADLLSGCHIEFGPQRTSKFFKGLGLSR